MSFGISFIVSALAEFFKGKYLVFFISGLFCILFVLLIKIFNFYTLRKHQICTEALLVVDDKARLGFIVIISMKNLSKYLFQFVERIKLLKNVGKKLSRKNILIIVNMCPRIMF